MSWANVSHILLCWDRAPSIKPDSLLYGYDMNRGGIHRFDVASGELHRTGIGQFASLGFVCLATGHILSAERRGSCVSLIVYDRTGSTGSDYEFVGQIDCELIFDLVLIDSIRTLVTSDAVSKRLFTLTLPPQYFLLPKCCDRDL